MTTAQTVHLFLFFAFCCEEDNEAMKESILQIRVDEEWPKGESVLLARKSSHLVIYQLTWSFKELSQLEIMICLIDKQDYMSVK